MSDVADVSAEQVRVRAALERQLQALESLVARFEEALRGIPHAAHSEIWRGEAHRLYVAAVESLGRDLASADMLIRSAVSHTRRAVSVMADRVG